MLFPNCHPAGNHLRATEMLLAKPYYCSGRQPLPRFLCLSSKYSSKPKYPAICEGTYSLSGQAIEFVNQCAWTAEFDWTYILSGTFTIQKEGDELLLIRSYGDAVYDTYRIKKQ